MKKDTGTFEIQDKILPYLRAEYGDTKYNERCVEVPVILDIYSKVKKKGDIEEKGVRVLEIGTIIPHYHPRWTEGQRAGTKKSVYPHLCINIHDEYEGVLRRDILDWKPRGNERFDLIFSISSMNHILDGKNVELSSRENNFRDIVNTMKSWLAKDGIMIFTIPFSLPDREGSRAWVDKYLCDISKRFGEQAEGHGGMIRDSDPGYVWKMNRMGYGMAGSKWHEARVGKDPDLSYDLGVPSAGTVYFLIWGNLWNLWK
jgi:hypothetical protein